jgi:hypothetical protein
MYSAYKPEAIDPLGIVRFPDQRSEVWQRFLWEVDKVYSNEAGDELTEGGLWWAELDKLAGPAGRPWFVENISRQGAQHPRVALCGTICLWT